MGDARTLAGAEEVHFADPMVWECSKTVTGTSLTTFPTPWLSKVICLGDENLGPFWEGDFDGCFDQYREISRSRHLSMTSDREILLY